jgi:hypothetical protein
VGGSYNILTATTAAPTALSEISGHPGTKWGGSVMAALQIKNLPTGTADDIKIDASYAKGDTKNVIATSSTSPSFAMFGGSNRAYQSVGFGATTDGVWLPIANGGTGDIKLTEAYGIRGAFNHNWNPLWSSSLFGSYSAVRYNGTVGTPFKNMTFSGEVQWFHLDQGFAGTATLAPTAPKPATVYEYKDQNAVSLQLRAQRNF